MGPPPFHVRLLYAGHPIIPSGVCAFRAIACLCQTLFALNGVYLLNEKGAVAAVDGFALSPPGFAKRVASLFADLGSGDHAAGLDRLGEIIAETRSLSSR